MTQKSISILLLFAFFSYQTYHVLVYLNYYVNYDYYVNVLCENKDKPEKKCNGKCHLKKQLEQQKPVNDERPFSKSSNVFYPEIIGVLVTSQNKCNYYQNGKNIGINQSSNYSNSYLVPVFHPPKLLC